VTEHPHVDNNGARYSLLGNPGVHTRLLGSQTRPELISPLALLLKSNVFVMKIKNTFIFEIIQFINLKTFFAPFLRIAIQSTWGEVSICKE